MKNLISVFVVIICIFSIPACSKKQTPSISNDNNEIKEDNTKQQPTITPGQKIHNSQTIKLNPDQINKLKQTQQQGQPNNNANPNALPGSTNPVAPSQENNKVNKPQ